MRGPPARLALTQVVGATVEARMLAGRFWSLIPCPACANLFRLLLDDAADRVTMARRS
jgi:hypothetical protein